MEDLFYFTKANVGLDDIAQIATAAGCQVEQHDTPSPMLRIYDTPRVVWEWSVLNADDGDFDSFETPQQEQLAVYQPVSAFQITFHVQTLPQLKGLLKQALNQYDGWVGCDDGTFETIFSLDTIGSLHLPYL